MPTTEAADRKARVERVFLVAMIMLAIFMFASLYVRVTSVDEPFWTQLAMPLFLAVLGTRVIALPAAPDKVKSARWIGILLIACAALVLILNLLDS